MKKIVLMLLISFLVSFQLKAQLHYATLTGQVPDTIKSILVNTSSYFGIKGNTDTVKVKPDNTFTHRIKLNSAGKVYLAYGDNKNITLWLKPGDQLDMDLHAATPIFKGSASIFANYYLDDRVFWAKIYKEYQQRNPKFDEGSNQSTDKYFVIQDSIITERTNFLKKYFTTHPDKDAQPFIKKSSLSLYYCNMYYKLMFSRTDVEKFKFYQDKYHIKRADHYDYSDNADFNNASLLSIDYYREFFCAMVTETARKRIRDKGEKFSFNKLIDLGMPIIDEFTAGANTNMDLKAIFLNSFEWEVKANKSLEMANRINSAILAIPGWKAYASLKIVKEKNDERILDTKFKKGNQAPDFVFKDIAGKTYGLNDFKGKKIYIDMGASWCSPCIATIPAWNKLVETNKDNERIIFISVSLDDTEKEWKIFLSKHPVNGMLLFAGGGFKGSFATSYSITAIPHFMLIDESGKILQYTAPYPDSEEILPYLKKMGTDK